MSQQGPILVVSTARPPSFAAGLATAGLFPVIEAEWADAVRAVDQVQPAAVVAASSEIDPAGLAALAARTRGKPPLSAADCSGSADSGSREHIPFFQTQQNIEGRPDH